MNNELATLDVARAMLDDATTTITDALGSAVPPEQWRALALAVIDGDTDIQQCTALSVRRALVTCASMGLTPAGKGTPQVQRMAVIIKRWDKHSKTNKATVMVEWRGLKMLMERHPDAIRVESVLVHKDDVVTFDPGTREITGHDLANPFSRSMNNETIIGGYLVAYMVDGSRRFHIVTAEDIAKAHSGAESEAFWGEWPMQMARKTIYRAAASAGVITMSSTSDYSRHLGAAMEADNDAMGYDREPVDVTPVVSPRVAMRVVLQDAKRRWRTADAVNLVTEITGTSNPDRWTLEDVDAAKAALSGYPPPKEPEPAPAPEVIDTTATNVDADSIAAFDLWKVGYCRGRNMDPNDMSNEQTDQAWAAFGEREGAA